MTKPFAYRFARPSVTATVVVISTDDRSGPSGRFAIGRRQLNADAFPGVECVPGGFLDCKIAAEDISPEASASSATEAQTKSLQPRAGETVEEAAVREVGEEIGIDIAVEDLRLVHVSSHPDTDPRAHVVNVVYYVEVPESLVDAAVAGDDIEEDTLRWLSIADAFSDDLVLAFDHKDLVRRALETWWRDVALSDLGLRSLAETVAAGTPATRTPAEAVQAAGMLPSGADIVVQMTIKRVGVVDGFYLDSEEDYRLPTNLSLVLNGKTATAIAERAGAATTDDLIGRTLIVKGTARLQKIWFKAGQAPRTHYYYQTHLNVDDPDQVIKVI